MTPAVVLIVVALAVVVLVGALAVSRRRSGPVRTEPGDVQVFAHDPFRITWPPDYAHSVPLRTEQNSSGTYVVESFASRSSALEVLRGCDVRDERVYLIAETPEGNIGRDLVWIFEEQDGSFIEIAERTPLPEPTFSRTDCARCGYTVLPMGRPGAGISVDGGMTVSHYLVAGDIERAGQGLECQECGALGCMHCYLHNADGLGSSSDHRCWLCQGSMGGFFE